MRDLLISDKAPYILTIVVAAAGWLISTQANRIADSPAISYTEATVTQVPPEITANAIAAQQFNCSPHDDIFIVSLRNLSSKHAFGKLEFVIATKELARFDSSVAIAAPPAHEIGSRLDAAAPLDAIFDIPGFQPGEQVILAACFQRPATGILYLRPTSAPVRLMRKGLDTFVYQRYLGILWALFGVLVLGGMGIIIAGRGGSGQQRKEG